MKTLVIHPKDKTTDFLKPIYHGRDYTVITGGCTKDDVAKAIDEHDHIIMMGHGTPQGLLAVGQFNRKATTTLPVKSVQSGSKPKTVYSTRDIDAFVDDFESERDGDWFHGGFVAGPTKKYVSGGGSASPQYGSSWNGGSYVIDDSNADQLRGKKITAIWCNADQYMEWNNLDGFYTGMFISDTGEARMIGTADTEQWQVDESNYAFSAIMRQLIGYQHKQLHPHLLSLYGKLADHNAVARYNLKRLYLKENSKAGNVTATTTILRG